MNLIRIDSEKTYNMHRSNRLYLVTFKDLQKVIESQPQNSPEDNQLLLLRLRVSARGVVVLGSEPT